MINVGSNLFVCEEESSVRVNLPQLREGMHYEE
jgi:hypothetical protein